MEAIMSDLSKLINLKIIDKNGIEISKEVITLSSREPIVIIELPVNDTGYPNISVSDAMNLQRQFSNMIRQRLSGELSVNPIVVPENIKIKIINIED